MPVAETYFDSPEVMTAIELLCSDKTAMLQGQRLNVDGGFYLR